MHLSAPSISFDAGDVVELTLEGEATSALVLLATDDFAILDPCDGRVPLVLSHEELGDVRVFHPDLVAVAAA